MKQFALALAALATTSHAADQCYTCFGSSPKYLPTGVYGHCGPNGYSDNAGADAGGGNCGLCVHDCGNDELPLFQDYYGLSDAQTTSLNAVPGNKDCDGILDEDGKKTKCCKIFNSNDETLMNTIKNSNYFLDTTPLPPDKKVDPTGTCDYGNYQDYDSWINCGILYPNPDRDQQQCSYNGVSGGSSAHSGVSALENSWGWSMGPFSGASAGTYQFNIYRSSQNGCNREDGDPDTKTGTVTLDVEHKGNLLEFLVIAQTTDYAFSETQVYISTTAPDLSKRPPVDEDSSKCILSGGSDSTCTIVTSTTHFHDIVAGTANANQMTTSDSFYFWMHASESTTGSSAYARSAVDVSCEDTLEVHTPAPVPSPTKAPVSSPVPPPISEDEGSCFHGNGTVELESGKSVPFSELSLGDIIKTSNSFGHFSYAPVLVLPHSQNAEPALFLTLTTETGKSVSMTTDHFIPKCDEEMVTAGELVVGDCLLTIDGKETLKEISASRKGGVYTAITKDKFIVVDGVVASPHSRNSDPSAPEQDFVKYHLELERERLRKLAYFSRKARAIKKASGLMD